MEVNISRSAFLLGRPHLVVISRVFRQQVVEAEDIAVYVSGAAAAAAAAVSVCVGETEIERVGLID